MKSCGEVSMQCRRLRHSAAEKQGRAGEGWVTAAGSTEVGRMKEKKG